MLTDTAIEAAKPRDKPYKLTGTNGKSVANMLMVGAQGGPPGR